VLIWPLNSVARQGQQSMGTDKKKVSVQNFKKEENGVLFRWVNLVSSVYLLWFFIIKVWVGTDHVIFLTILYDAILG
jgi:hypothetical protein